jgi:tRNA (cmo5U34)-methyltransferase
VDVKALFDGAAADYDRTRRQFIPCFDDFYGTALEQIPFARDASFRVLDLGAGTGLLSALVSAAFPGATLTLADFAPEMLEKARQRFADRPNFSYVQVDFVQDQLAGQYEVVMSALALHHTPPNKLKSVFEKIYAVLVSGGLFIHADQTLGTSAANERKYQDAWLKGAKGKGCSDVDIQVAIERMRVDQTSPLEAQLAWLREAGFVDVDCWYKNYRFAVYSGRKP